MTGQPPVTLESLAFHWGDAYLICYARDQWAALRRDTRRFLTAPPWTSWRPGSKPTTRHPRYRATLTRPAPPTTSRPGPGPGRATRTRTTEGAGPGRGEAGAADPAAGDVPAVGHQLLAVFPGLDRPQRRRHHLPELTRPALHRAAIERQERRDRHGPGRDWPPGEDTPPVIDPRPAPRVVPHARPCMRYHPAMAGDTQARAGPHHHTGPDVPRARRARGTHPLIPPAPAHRARAAYRPGPDR